MTLLQLINKPIYHLPLLVLASQRIREKILVKKILIMAMGGSLPPKSELALNQSPEQVRATSSGPKKKGTVRAWLVLNTTGQAQVLEAGKSDIMSRTGLPGRDLRSLDPVLSYPSSILGRERAIVINLENIKAIVTHNEVLLLNSRDPSVTPFIEELQKRLHFHYHSCHTQV